MVRWVRLPQHECSRCTWNNPQKIGNETGRQENKGAGGEHPYYSIIKIGLSTDKVPGDVRRLAVTQSAVKIN